MDAIKGAVREKNLEKKAYFSNLYFSMPLLCSLSHQINCIWQMQPKNILEIGIGNGFISTYLKRAGFNVKTVDINPALEPDVCAPIQDLEKYFPPNEFDVVVCCEVLEHMPFEEFSANIEKIKAVGSRLFLTLPNYRRVFGIGGFFNFYFFGYRLWDLNIEFPHRRPLEDTQHFWEVGYTNQTSKKNIIKKLQRFYPSVKSGRFTLMPYHIYFICE